MVPSYVITDTHQQAMKRYGVAGECSIVEADWPYDCDAKREHPDHVVYVCETHGAWWHEPRNQTTKSSTEYGWVTIARTVFEQKRQHGYAGIDDDGTAWVLDMDANGGTCLWKGVTVDEEA